MQAAERIRYLRKRQGLTLEALAQQCECTRSLLSKIENGRSNPSVAILNRIATSLNTSVSALLHDGTSNEVLFEPAAERTCKNLKSDHGYEYDLLASGKDNKLMQPYIFRLKKGEVKSHNLQHKGEEFIYILEGQIRYRVGQQEYRMEKGDSLYFDSLQEHEVTPLSETATYIAIFSEEKTKE